jgi:phage terminase large subunit-like protein
MISGLEVRRLARTDFARIAFDYATAVVSREVVACKWVKAACQPHLDDLAASEREDFPFRFDEEKADRVCRFCELFEHIKGPKAGHKLDLEGWQVFIVASVFGWVRKDTGARRFRKSYIEIPRGNAKSTLSAVLGNYCTAADGESGAEVFSAATKREQARIVFDVAQNMARRCPGFRRKLGVRVDANAIVQPVTASIFRPLAAEDGTLDGLNVHLAIVDELHAHKSRALYDVLETGAGKRAQSLMWTVTTAGSNQAGICYEIRTYVTKILEGVFRDDSFFGIIYTIDEGDDWKDPSVWVKANPNWGVSVMPDVFGQLALKATRTPSAVNNFKTKYLDVWTNADVSWMDLSAWRRGAVADLNEVDFEGERCWGGLDLASKIDIAPLVKIFKRMVPGADGKSREAHYYAFMKAWLPEAAIEASSNSQYAGWAASGLLTVTPGNVIDYGEIEEELESWPARFEVVGVAYDPFQATQFSLRMAAKGFPMIEVRATVQNFSEPMKELDALVRNGRFHHDGNPLFEWMVSNVVCHTDKKDNIYPNKQTSQNKIDGVIATIMALSRALLDEGDDGSGFAPFVV